MRFAFYLPRARCRRNVRLAAYSRLREKIMMLDTKLGDDFSLDFISARLMGFQVPEEPFDPNGDWRLEYGVYTMSTTQRGPTPGGLVGRMSLTRKAVGEEEAELTLDYRKNGPGAVQHVAAKICCKTDALSTPVTWQYSAQVVDAQGKVYENSKISKRGRAEDGRVEITDSRTPRRLAVSGPFTINWALWDAVMRMPARESEPLRFTMLDHFDQIKRRQTLAFRKSPVVTLGQRRVKEQTWKELEKGRIRQTQWATVGGRDATLHAFEQLGEGIVPWVYWTDEQGRLLFAVAGLEVYALKTASNS